MLCAVDLCTVRASFGVDKPVRCRSHRLPGDKVFLLRKSNNCSVSGCGLVAVYETKGLKLCFKHKVVGCIDKLTVRKHRDVCKVEGCGLYASYGNEKKKRLYCSKHKTADCRLQIGAVCIEQGCGVYATFGKTEENFGRFFCAKHRPWKRNRRKK